MLLGYKSLMGLAFTFGVTSMFWNSTEVVVPHLVQVLKATGPMTLNSSCYVNFTPMKRDALPSKRPGTPWTQLLLQWE